MIAFAAQIACLTEAGAPSGAAARPLSRSFAARPGTVGWATSAPAGAAGWGVGSSYATPPGPSAAMADGTTLSASANSTQMTIRGLPRTTTLFRRPAGLADGLARKEPAPLVDIHGTRPKQPGSPAPRTVRGFGVACKISDEGARSPTQYSEVGIDHSSRPAGAGAAAATVSARRAPATPPPRRTLRAPEV